MAHRNHNNNQNNALGDELGRLLQQANSGANIDLGNFLFNSAVSSNVAAQMMIPDQNPLGLEALAGAALDLRQFQQHVPASSVNQIPQQSDADLLFVQQMSYLAPEHQADVKELYIAFQSQKISNDVFMKKVKEIVGNQAFSQMMLSMKQASSGIRPRPTSSNTNNKPTPSVSSPHVAPSSKSPNNAPSPQQSKDNAVDPISLQDVIKVAGVDLLAESEMILKDLENKKDNQSMLDYIDETKVQTFVDPIFPLQVRVRKIAKLFGLRQVDSDVDLLLSIALKQKLQWLLEQAVRISKYRVETKRENWELELCDGESLLNRTETEGKRSRVGAVKRPLVWLERFDKNSDIRLAIETLKGSVSEEGRNAILEAGVVEEEQAPRLDADPEEDEKDPKKIKKGVASKDYWKEKDDQAIRQKQTNETALQAIGIDPKYSWMMTGALSSNLNKGQLESNSNMDTGKPEVVLSTKDATLTGFGLPRPEVRKRTLDKRNVQASDLLFAMKLDSSKDGRWARMRKSAVVCKAYT